MSTGRVTFNDESRRDLCRSHRDLLRLPAITRSTVQTVILGTSRLIDFGPWYRVDSQPMYSVLRHALGHGTTDVLAEDWRVVGDDGWRGLRDFATSVSDGDRVEALLHLFHVLVEQWNATPQQGDLFAQAWGSVSDRGHPDWHALPSIGESEAEESES